MRQNSVSQVLGHLFELTTKEEAQPKFDSGHSIYYHKTAQRDLLISPFRGQVAPPCDLSPTEMADEWYCTNDGKTSLERTPK